MHFLLKIALLFLFLYSFLLFLVFATSFLCISIHPSIFFVPRPIFLPFFYHPNLTFPSHHFIFSTHLLTFIAFLFSLTLLLILPSLLYTVFTPPYNPTALLLRLVQPEYLM